jgi:hypothetical protein
MDLQQCHTSVAAQSSAFELSHGSLLYTDRLQVRAVQTSYPNAQRCPSRHPRLVSHFHREASSHNHPKMTPCTSSLAHSCCSRAHYINTSPDSRCLTHSQQLFMSTSALPAHQLRPQNAATSPQFSPQAPSKAPPAPDPRLHHTRISRPRGIYPSQNDRVPVLYARYPALPLPTPSIAGGS